MSKKQICRRIGYVRNAYLFHIVSFCYRGRRYRCCATLRGVQDKCRTVLRIKADREARLQTSPGREGRVSGQQETLSEEGQGTENVFLVTRVPRGCRRPAKDVSHSETGISAMSRRVLAAYSMYFFGPLRTFLASFFSCPYAFLVLTLAPRLQTDGHTLTRLSGFAATAPEPSQQAGEMKSNLAKSGSLSLNDGWLFWENFSLTCPLPHLFAVTFTNTFAIAFAITFAITFQPRSSKHSHQPRADAANLYSSACQMSPHYPRPLHVLITMEAVVLHTAAGNVAPFHLPIAHLLPTSYFCYCRPDSHLR